MEWSDTAAWDFSLWHGAMLARLGENCRFVGEEVLLYLLRLLEELEFDGVHSGLKPGQVSA